MALSMGSKNNQNIQKYSKGLGYLISMTGNNTSCGIAPGASWFQLGYMKDTQIKINQDNFSESDDTGMTVVNRNVVKDAQVQTTLLERDANTRNSITATGQYALCLVGTQMADSSFETWMFPWVTISKELDYKIGGDARIGLTFEVAPPPTNAVLTYPVALSSWPCVTTSGAASAVTVATSYNSGLYITKDIL